VCRITTNEEKQIDPTRTTTLRRQYMAEMYKRFRKVKGYIRKTLEENDALDLKEKPSILEAGPVRRFDATTSSEKIHEFMDWIHEVVDDVVLGEAVREAGEIIRHDRWQESYVRASYKKGIKHSLSRLKRIGIDPTDTLLADDVERLFAHPRHADAFGVIYEQNFEELKGVTEAMAQQISRELGQGLRAGDSVRTITRNINDRVDKIGLTRARVIARTETVRAHAEATLNMYEQAEVEEVTAEVEFTSIDDERRCKECEDLTLEGRTYTVDEAHDVIPVHPNCRCTWLPVVRD